MLSMNNVWGPMMLLYIFKIYLKIIFYGLFWFRNYFFIEISEGDLMQFFRFLSISKTKNKPFCFFWFKQFKALV